MGGQRSWDWGGHGGLHGGSPAPRSSWETVPEETTAGKLSMAASFSPSLSLKERRCTCHGSEMTFQKPSVDRRPSSFQLHTGVLHKEHLKAAQCLLSRTWRRIQLEQAGWAWATQLQPAGRKVQGGEEFYWVCPVSAASIGLWESVGEGGTVRNPSCGTAAVWALIPLPRGVRPGCSYKQMAAVGLCSLTTTRSAPFGIPEDTCRAGLVAFQGQRYCSSFLKMLLVPLLASF